MSTDSTSLSPPKEVRRHDAPAAIPLVALVVGIAASGHLTNPTAAIAGLAASALIFAAARPFTVPLRRVASIVLVFAAIGVATAHREAITEGMRDTELSRFDSSRFVEIEGSADGIWMEARGGARLTIPDFEIRQGSVSNTIDRPLAIYAPAIPHGSGTRIRAEGFLRRPESGRWYLAVKSPRLIAWIDAPEDRAGPRAWNRRMNRALATLANEEPGLSRPIALARALALGRKEALTESIRDDYRSGGTYHVLVFSGLQIALAAAFVLLLLRPFRRPRLADAALLAMAIFAPLFAGFEPSVVRASSMVGLFAISRFLHRPTRVENLLFVSAILRLVAVPGELTDAGFLLTYAATGGLLYGGRWMARDSSGFRRAVAFGLGAEATTLPLTALFFHRYVLGGAIVTAALGPIVALMLGLSTCASIAALAKPGHAVPFIAFLSVLDRLAVRINSAVRLVPGATGNVIGPPPWSLGVALLVATAMAGTRWRRRGAIAVVALLLPIASIPIREVAARCARPRSFSVEALDVGQGDAILVRNGDDAILVDGGGSADDPAFGRRRLLPLLLERGVSHLDAIAITHPDEDHCGGFRTLIANVPIDEVWISPRHVASPCGRDVLEAARSFEVVPRLIRDGDREHIGRLSIESIVARLRYKRATTNNGSVLYRVDSDGMRALLTGDIEKEAEYTLATEERSRIRADVLKIAHHGAATSTSDVFLDAVRPRVAVISCGRHNRFGHPSASALARIYDHRVLVWRTDRSRSIAIQSYGRGLRVRHGDIAATEN